MKALIKIFWGILLITLLSGCLGKHRSTTGTNAPATGISYAGSTGQATLTTANSAVILAGALQGGQTGNAFSSAASLTTSGAEPQQPTLLLLSQSLVKAIQQADLGSLQGPNLAAAVNNVSHQVAGKCGGLMSYAGTADDASRQFYATFTFDNYCQDATTFTGTATASGQTDATLGFSTLSLSFTALTIASKGDSFTADGYEIITPATASLAVSMNMLLQDDASKLVYKINQLALTILQGNGYVDIGISPSSNVNKNLYYDPRYGYVELSTPSFLHIVDSDYWPSSGVLEATGAPGSLTTTTGFDTSASFTAQSNTTYQLNVDTDGGGSYTTTTGLWSAL